MMRRLIVMPLGLQSAGKSVDLYTKVQQSGRDTCACVGTYPVAGMSWQTQILSPVD